MHRFVEDYPAIDIGELQRRGLFVRQGQGEVRVSPKGVVAIFVYKAGETFLTVAFPGRDFTDQRIELRSKPLRFGDRRFFYCGKARVNASKLHLVDGVFASRRGHGLKHLSQTGRAADIARGRTERLAGRLRGASGKGAARGNRRAALIAELSSPSNTGKVDKATASILARAAKKARAETVALHEDNGGGLYYSTQHAMRRFESDGGGSEPFILRTTAPMIEQVASGNCPVYDAYTIDPADAEPRARLDIRALVGSGLVQPGLLRATSLEWGRTVLEIFGYLWIVADLRNPERPYLLLHGWAELTNEELYQAIKLSQINGRWYMRCPVTGRPASILYLNRGFFTSRNARTSGRRSGKVMPSLAF